MFVVAVGNIIDGATFYGPFFWMSDAMTWAEHEISDEEYHIIELETPDGPYAEKCIEDGHIVVPYKGGDDD